MFLAAHACKKQFFFLLKTGQHIGGGVFLPEIDETVPLSIAAGYAYDAGWGQVYASVEYFMRIREYNIMTPRPAAFIRIAGIDDFYSSDVLKFKDARKAILNAGLGVSCLLRPGVTGFLPFARISAMPTAAGMPIPTVIYPIRRTTIFIICSWAAM